MITKCGYCLNTGKVWNAERDEFEVCPICQGLSSTLGPYEENFKDLNAEEYIDFYHEIDEQEDNNYE